MPSEQSRVEIGAEGVDIMEHQRAQGRALLQHGREGAVEEEVGDFVPVADRVEALERLVIAVVGAFAGGFGP